MRDPKLNENKPDFWNLIPMTPDAQLNKIVKANTTVSFIVEGMQKFIYY